MTLMSAAVQLRGGIDASFASPSIVVFKLTRVNQPANPACAFRLNEEVPLVLKGDDVRIVAENSWKDLDEACQRDAERIRADNPHPCYVGSLSAMVWVEGTEIAAYHPYPIYGLRTQGTGPISPLTSMVFEQIVTMCIGTMNAGFVLRGPSGPCRVRELLPDVGVLVKGKKKWEWKKQEGWAWNRAVGLQSRMKPEMLWQMFYML